MIHNNLRRHIDISLLVSCLCLIFLFWLWTGSRIATEPLAVDLSCVTLIRGEEAIGSSLEPYVENGEILKTYYGYYECNELDRGDIVLYDHPGFDYPLVKIVKAIPGDSLSVLKAGVGRFNLMVNGKMLKNSENIAYILSEDSAGLLDGYGKGNRGVIQDGAYIILGDQPGGTIDSFKFGLVHKDDIIARVFRDKDR